ncbi:DUF4145 domain-containing protein [Nocardia salmonicida]|uniref:DUF4145 domain-containing protein n=1 Tax=Nocardia salmonicida TaxID=53431 RepID=UPI0033EA6DDA
MGTAVIEERRNPGSFMHAKTVPLHWWPILGSAVDMADVPADLAEAYQEGVRCISVEAPHAAVAMFRNALAHIVQDKGSVDAKSKRTLHDSITQMIADKTLPEVFLSWATHIRKVGNAGAHQEAFEKIPLDQAKELEGLVLALIEYLYIQPARFDRMKPATKRPKP